MTAPAERVLLIGYGNPARGDDGLGPAVAAAAAALALPGVTVETAFQLQVEDAATIAEHDVVVFADACAAGDEPFSFRPLAPRDDASFTTHHVSPEGVLALAHRLLGARTRGYLLAIRGRRFDVFDEHLTDAARRNLDAALARLGPALRDRDFDACVRASAAPVPPPELPQPG